MSETEGLKPKFEVTISTSADGEMEVFTVVEAGTDVPHVYISPDLSNREQEALANILCNYMNHLTMENPK